MSLSSLLETNEDVRRYLRERFRKPSDSHRATTIAAPLTTRYQLVGTAFDYLLRWWLRSRHPFAIEAGPWIAELAVESLKRGSRDHAAARKILRGARRETARLTPDQAPADTILEAALKVAKLDPIYRAPFVTEPLSFRIGRDDVADLRNLFRALPIDRFVARKYCVLNPAFKASQWVDGADVDLVLDDLMLDVKTTKDPKCWRAYFNQLIGYYLLYLLGGFAIPGRQPRIARLAIYFARQGHFEMWRVRDIASREVFREAALWLKQRASNNFGRGLTRKWT